MQTTRGTFEYADAEMKQIQQIQSSFNTSIQSKQWQKLNNNQQDGAQAQEDARSEDAFLPVTKLMVKDKIMMPEQMYRTIEDNDGAAVCPAPVDMVGIFYNKPSAGSSQRSSSQSSN